MNETTRAKNKEQNELTNKRKKRYERKQAIDKIN